MISYTDRHALEMLIALELEDMGQTPDTVTRIVPAITGYFLNSAKQRKPGPAFFVLNPAALRGSTFISWMKEGDPLKDWKGPFDGKQLAQYLDNAPIAFAVIDVEACEKRLLAELERVAGAAG